MVELPPRPPLSAEEVIEERGVEVRIVGDEKDVSSPRRSVMKGSDALHRVFLRERSELPPAVGIERVDRASAFGGAFGMLRLEPDEEAIDLATLDVGQDHADIDHLVVARKESGRLDVDEGEEPVRRRVRWRSGRRGPTIQLAQKRRYLLRPESERRGDESQDQRPREHEEPPPGTRGF